MTGTGLFVYCFLLTAITGDIGFEGDDWWILSWPYWNEFPKSIWIYARESLRPLEGVYWIGLFELFGFNKIVFHLFSLLLLASASLLMGFALVKAFPNRKNFATLAVLLAFFLPTLSCLTYVLATDNGRLSMLLFWACVLAFQKWAEGPQSWLRLLPPVAIYVAAFLTYEAPTLLVFTIPLLVFPVHARSALASSNRIFCFKLGTAVCMALVVAIAIRFTILSGGAVGHRHLLPPVDLLWSYLALLPYYLTAPFSGLLASKMEIVLAAAIMGLALIAVYSGMRSAPASQCSSSWVDGNAYIGLVGIAILLCGMLPYQLAGYGSVVPRLEETVLAKWGFIPHGNTAWFNFNWSSRIYSAASFGVAILIALLATFPRTVVFRRIAGLAVVVFIGLAVVFHAGLRKDWQEAAHIRNNLVKSLISEVPEVKPGTNLLFLNLESSHQRAAVFRGWGGLRELVRMLYGEKAINAWFLYPDKYVWPNSVFQQAIVTQKGFVTRGMKLDQPASLDSLIILKKEGSHFSLVDGINSPDGISPTGILWKDAYAIRSNQDRIVTWSHEGYFPRKYVRNALESGLISTLRLSGVRLGFKLANRWSLAFCDRRISKAVFRKGIQGKVNRQIR
jgi:hypothetical protein